MLCDLKVYDPTTHNHPSPVHTLVETESARAAGSKNPTQSTKCYNTLHKLLAAVSL